ncbi:hypothetical protein BDZ89DRAFT_155781 [Hymenopellis radicata]|nr:hypothetical protein BDZ89DRAFT_155781 [Hymenopellis radicata]
MSVAFAHSEPKPKRGQIYESRESLILPYHKLFLQALRDVEDSETYRSASAETRESLKRAKTACSKTIKRIKAKRTGRPVIISGAPEGYMGTVRPWVFPMGTFEGQDYQSLPDALKRFAVPVLLKESRPEDLPVDKYIRTRPAWMPQRQKPAWVVAIVLSPGNHRYPSKRWVHRGTGDEYEVPTEEYSKLMSIRNVLAVEFQNEIEKPEFMLKFWQDLQKSKSKPSTGRGGTSMYTKMASTSQMLSVSVPEAEIAGKCIPSRDTFVMSKTDASNEETDHIGTLISAVNNMNIKPKGVLQSLRSVASKRYRARHRRNSAASRRGSVGAK